MNMLGTGSTAFVIPKVHRLLRDAKRVPRRKDLSEEINKIAYTELFF